MSVDDSPDDPWSAALPRREDDLERAAILARRRHFIVIALSGLTAGTGCAPCLKVALPTTSATSTSSTTGTTDTSSTGSSTRSTDASTTVATTGMTSGPTTGATGGATETNDTGGGGAHERTKVARARTDESSQ